MPPAAAFAAPATLRLSRPPSARAAHPRRHRVPPRHRAPPRAVALSPDGALSPPDAVAHYVLTVLTPSSPPHPRPAAAAAPFPSIEALVTAAGGAVRAWRALSARAAEAPLALPRATAVDPLRNALYAHGRQSGVDVVLQEESVVRAAKRLAVFDLDSTLIAQETIDELAAQVNLQEHVKRITERAMNGEIGFRDALAQRVALLKGLPVRALDGVKDRVQFTPGARRLVRALREMGCTTAVVSGGFHFLADHVRDELGLDHSYANRLEVDAHGILTGRTIGDVVDAEYKENTLKRLATELAVPSEQVLAVGDGSNDLLMMRSAGTGVAFNAKPIVQDRAKCRVNQPSLENVLYLLGLSDHDIGSLVGEQNALF